MKLRQSNNPKRRIAPPGSLSAQEQASLLAATRYVGSALHKRTPGDYGFHPPANPRAHKSLCDDLRAIPLQEAQRLFAAGIGKSMVSTYRGANLPKYVWSVDEWGEVYEAKLGNEGYHGHRLDEDVEHAMRALVLRVWNAR
jgi:hypothetical protein